MASSDTVIRNGKIWLLLKFLLPTLIGILLFLTPITYGGKQTILMAIITDFLRAPLEPILLGFIVSVVALGAVGSGIYVIFKPNWQEEQPSLYAAFHATPAWLFIRTLGAVIGLMVYFQIGPEFVWSIATGQTVFIEIGAAVFFILLVACMLMPFLTDYGFMEFVGVLLRKPFSMLFNLPGRAAIDATASLVSAASVGMLITINQYEKGFYSARQSASVATNFSIVSIPFSLAIAEVAGLGHLFFTWYLVVIAACLICAVITVRIPPLARIPDTYNGSVGKQIHEDTMPEASLFTTSLQNAMRRAENAPGPIQFIKNGWYASLDVVFGVIGPAMAITTIATILAVHTEIFSTLSLPIYYILDAINLPEAQTAAPGFIVGFLDQFMPALVAKDIDSELTRFVLAGLSVTQLIYMAEIGVIILRSSLPLNFGHLAIIFTLRTIIVFPVFLAAGFWLL
ncbi:YjiH family protein [Kordiimonas aquimaris]|uniref:YjiH family protein n=1 Tax=Kordiimonas aquimaris TaxID=707591 RepID=UPI0021CE322D|nr:YjiH family protein [Kordiimonas aquimaris]